MTDPFDTMRYELGLDVVEAVMALMRYTGESHFEFAVETSNTKPLNVVVDVEEAS